MSINLLLNEATSPVEVYFDDFKVTHIKSPVIQQDDYYPGGSRFNGYTRENSLFNKRLYNAGSEIQNDAGKNSSDRLRGSRVSFPALTTKR